VLIVFLKNFVSIYTNRWVMILGAIYIVTVLYAPKGLLDVKNSHWGCGSGRSCGPVLTMAVRAGTEREGDQVNTNSSAVDPGVRGAECLRLDRVDKSFAAWRH